MSARPELNDHDWFLLSSVPPLIGAVISSTEASGVVGTMREIAAALRGAKIGRQDYPDNSLISEALHSSVMSVGDGIAKAHEHREILFERMNEADAHTPEEIHDQLLRDCAEVRDILEEKADPQEGAEYLMWAVDIGVKVAEAGREGGGMLGMGRGSVSEAEGRALREICDALGITASTAI